MGLAGQPQCLAQGESLSQRQMWLFARMVLKVKQRTCPSQKRSQSEGGESLGGCMESVLVSPAVPLGRPHTLTRTLLGEIKLDSATIVQSVPYPVSHEEARRHLCSLCLSDKHRTTQAIDNSVTLMWPKSAPLSARWREDSMFDYFLIMTLWMLQIKLRLFKLSPAG